MNISSVIIQTIGGLGLFILGMQMMTEGLQRSAGDRIKKILGAVSSNRIIGCLTGMSITALVQSSSATTVMIISFVSAGVITLQQAVGITLGANIGTTVTAQMIAFKLTSLALPAIGLGVALKFFSRRRYYRYLGEVILGFGLLFFGMLVMKQGLLPIKSDPAFIGFFTKFDPSTAGGLLFCVATGAILTIMVQSSSATVGLTMTLATQGLLTFPAAMALVLGENIGTTITAQIATIGTSNINARRTANAHTMFNVIGVCIMLLIFPLFLKVVVFVTGHMQIGPVNEIIDGDMVNISRYIANGHTMFNVINVSFFLLALPWLIKGAIILSPRQKESEEFFTLPDFDNRYIDNPIAALAHARSEVVAMSESARAMLANTIKCLEDKNTKSLHRWRYYEDHLDSMQKEITAYLTTIYQGDVNEYEAKEISGLMRITNNIERIGDSVENIALRTEDLIEQRLEFSSAAYSDMEKLSDLTIKFLSFIIEGLKKRAENFMTESQVIEDSIDVNKEEMIQGHISRLRDGSCKIEPGLLYIDILSNYEKIGDYCYNIAQSIAGIK